ncbi:MAG: hypothetical protein ACQGVK_22030 [Myxococcota bacterium]
MTFVMGLVAGLAAPALAGTFYSWTTEDGIRAYTDDAKRVPARYRTRAQLRDTGSLDGYERFTPIESATPEAATRQAARSQARPVASLPSVSAPPPSRAPGVSLETGDLNIDLVGAEGGEPIVVEQVRTRVGDSEATRTVQVVRQGDRVLAIIKPTPNQTNLSDAKDESELLR